MESKLRYAGCSTPSPSQAWVNSPESDRLSRIAEMMTTDAGLRFKRWLSITSAKEDGQIIVRFQEQLSSGERGTLLLDFESFLKNTVDSGLVVWVEALGDKNSLRNLRGIEVKT